MTHFIRDPRKYIFGSFILLSGLWIGVSIAYVRQVDGNINRVSISNDGQQGNSDSQDSAISSNGQYIVFESEANNLVPANYNQVTDVFLYAVETGVLTGITTIGNWGGSDPAISADGRYIAFSSASSNLITNDQNGVSDVFVYDQLAGVFELISVTSSGQQGDTGSFLSSAISVDGRYVAFVSTASLVIDDTNFYHDVYVRDRLLGLTIRVSIDSLGHEGNNQSYWPTIAADGRFIAFTSNASNLVPDDTNNYPDVFLHDLQMGSTQRLSVSDDGEEGNHISWEPVISDNGRFVVFYSGANNLVADDTNEAYDAFLADLWLQTLKRVSLNSDEQTGNDGSHRPFISADGRFVVFASAADNMAVGDTNEAVDIFVRDIWRGVTERVNLTFNNQQTEWGYNSSESVISADGRIVAFTSGAPNLVEGDTNEL